MREVYKYNPNSQVHVELYQMLCTHYPEHYPQIMFGSTEIHCRATNEEADRLREVCMGFESGWEKCRSRMWRSTT